MTNDECNTHGSNENIYGFGYLYANAATAKNLYTYLDSHAQWFVVTISQFGDFCWFFLHLAFELIVSGVLVPRVFTHIFIHHDLSPMLGAREAENNQQTCACKMPKGFSYVDHGYVRSY